MKNIMSGILIVVAMMTLNLAPVYAGGHGQSTCKVDKLKSQMAMYWAYKDELKLTEDQLGKIAVIKHDAMKQMYRESAEAKVVKVDVKTELWAAQIDAAKVMPLIDAKYAAKAKIAKTMVQAFADAQAVLSDEQRNQMREIKTEKYLKENNIRGDSGCGGKYCPLHGKK